MVNRLSVRIAGQAEQPLVANLLQYYIYDFSEFSDEEFSADATFTYPYLDHYWQNPDRIPYLFYQAEKPEPVGFAMVRVETNPTDGNKKMDLAEFFVLRSSRRLGLGSIAAEAVWDLHAGTWTVRVFTTNEIGYRFWKPLIAHRTNGGYRETLNGTEITFEF